METTELLKKVRKIEIKTRGLSKQIFSGEYHSAFKGRGMAFSEVREYQYGDDIRSIDWNVTARYSSPYIKIFDEERELTVMLLIDVSKSQLFGTQESFKRELITELSAVLSFSAIQNNDKVGVIFFSDKIEKFIPPKKGKTHILRIIRELIEFQPESSGTDIASALAYLNNVLKKRSIVFLISDFNSDNFEKPLKIAKNKHDTIAIYIYDIREAELPNIGLIKCRDLETNQEKWLDTSYKPLRDAVKDEFINKGKMLDTIVSRNNIDLIRLKTGNDYVVPLMTFFKHRTGRK